MGLFKINFELFLKIKYEHLFFIKKEFKIALINLMIGEPLWQFKNANSFLNAKINMAFTYYITFLKKKKS